MMIYKNVKILIYKVMRYEQFVKRVFNELFRVC